MHSGVWLRGAALAACLAISAGAYGQQRRITGQIDNARRISLHGNVTPRARAEDDRGPADPSLQLTYVTLELAMSSSQKADLANLLAQQQDPNSPNYHRWLTPQQYAERFGVASADVAAITQWLEGQGLTIAAVAQGRNWIAVNGTAAQIGQAFSTSIHTYLVNGETHFANAAEPSVPAALAGVVQFIQGLNDFRMQPRILTPKYTSQGGNNYLAPDDIATIYDILPAYKAGIDGTGQKIVVAGQTAINLPDIAQFQRAFNMAPNLPATLLVPGSKDPGVTGDLAEADIDLEWSGAVARNAAITFVYANDVMSAVQYAIDQNLAPVISVSYGSCEPESQQSYVVNYLQAMARQGNAQGITWIDATGDNGAADCNDAQNPGLAVDAPASVPEVTGVGGTAFTEGSGAYWNTVNDQNGASALRYIPETSWNTSGSDGAPSASGGGVSIYFGKPTWQVGPGVPGDTARHVPDISLTASPDHDGYLVYTGGSTKPKVYGGTSCPTPVMAGIAALLNQYEVTNGIQAAAGLGNINPQLYALAQSSPAIFHDITTGNNVVTAQVTCSKGATCPVPTPVGYNAGPGYDNVTGLGSLDVWALITSWNGGIPAPVPTAKIAALTDAAAFRPQYSPGMIMTVFGSGLSDSTESAGGVPLPVSLAGVTATVNGLAAPFYYVSPGQLNVQVPYDIPVNSTATLQVNNNGQLATRSFTVAAASPGIFADLNGLIVPNASAAPGQITTVYLTGAGAVTPSIATGAAPSASTPLGSLPAPANPVVTVGGVVAPLQCAYCFAGIPYGLVGVVQINFQVPPVPAGKQPVVVTVNGVASPPAYLDVTN